MLPGKYSTQPEPDGGAGVGELGYRSDVLFQKACKHRKTTLSQATSDGGIGPLQSKSRHAHTCKEDDETSVS